MLTFERAIRRDLSNLARTVERIIVRVGTFRQDCNNRKYHVVSCRLAAALPASGTVDRVLTWPRGGFDDDTYIIELAPLDMEGQGTVVELTRSATQIEARITAGAGGLPAGSCFMVFGRSL